MALLVNAPYVSQAAACVYTSASCPSYSQLCLFAGKDLKLLYAYVTN